MGQSHHPCYLFCSPFFPWSFVLTPVFQVERRWKGEAPEQFLFKYISSWKCSELTEKWQQYFRESPYTLTWVSGSSSCPGDRRPSELRIQSRITRHTRLSCLWFPTIWNLSVWLPRCGCPSRLWPGHCQNGCPLGSCVSQRPCRPCSPLRGTGHLTVPLLLELILTPHSGRCF